MKKSKRALDTDLYFQLFQINPRKGDYRKIKIIESAIYIISSKGIEATSYDAIGGPIGLTRAHVAYYFPDKYELIKNIIEYITNHAQMITVGKLQSSQPTLENKVRAAIEGAFEWAELYPMEVRVMSAFYHMTTYRKELRELNTQIRDVGCKRLAEILGDSILAKTIQNLITGSLIDQTTTEPTTSLNKIKSHVIDHALTLIRLKQSRTRRA